MIYLFLGILLHIAAIIVIAAAFLNARQKRREQELARLFKHSREFLT